MKYVITKQLQKLYFVENLDRLKLIIPFFTDYAIS